MNQQNLHHRGNLTSISGIVLGTIAVVALISIKLLLVGNMGSWNEVDVLPLAKQYVEPTWIPGDWYLNQPPSYRVLFQSLFGWLIVNWGFLATSIVGRLICYSLVAGGLVLISRQIGLHLLLLLLAMRLFLRDSQGIVAGEWLLGGLESKAVAYGLVLLAIAFMLRRRYILMALLLGLATSFHVLVGGYTFLAALGWIFLRYKTRSPRLQAWGWMLLMYCIGSVFALQSINDKLFTPNYLGTLTPSYIYVFLRLPHHLNPLSWRGNWWITALVYLLILTLSLSIIWFYRPSPELSEQRNACAELFEFTLISLIPFVIGLAIAPFDSQGRFLQYYPFRLGDIMLPLNTCLLSVRAVQQIFTGQTKQKLLLITCAVILTVTVARLSLRLPNDLQSLSQFPDKQQRENSQSKDIYTWVQNQTSPDTTFISPPVELSNFTWLAERPTIAKYKFLPQTPSAIWEWYKRLCDLAGVDQLKRLQRQALTAAYQGLTTNQVKALMLKYKAPYIVTKVSHQLDLPVVYRNQSYIIYRQSK